MKLLLSSFTILLVTLSFSQKELKDYYLQRSLKQGGEQFQFQVLDEDKKGIWFHRKSKFYFWYKAQHVISTQGGSSGVLLNGKFESFYENKQLAKKGNFKKGLKSGEWLYWRDDGTLKVTEKWYNGELKYRIKYNDKGFEVEKTTFKGNSYYREAKDTIVNSKRSGKKEELIIKNSDGEVIRIEQRKNGKLDGKVKIYSEGKLIEEQNYSNGVLILEENKTENKDESEDDKKSIKDWFKNKKKKDKKLKQTGIESSTTQKNKASRKKEKQPRFKKKKKETGAE